MDMDTAYAIELLGLNHCSYNLDDSVTPNEIIAWYGPDPEPTVAEMQAAWDNFESTTGGFAKLNARRERSLDYQLEADPLFFKWQAGEGTREEWIAKREEIKARYPYA